MENCNHWFESDGALLATTSVMSGHDSHFPKPSSNKQKSAPKTFKFLIQLSDFYEHSSPQLLMIRPKFCCIWMMNLIGTIFSPIFANLIDSDSFISQIIRYYAFDLASSSCESDEDNFLARFSLSLQRICNALLLLVTFVWLLLTSLASVV